MNGYNVTIYEPLGNSDHSQIHFDVKVILAKLYWNYLSSVFTRQDISSLPVPDAKFQEDKLDYIEQLIVTPGIVATKIKAIINHLEWKNAVATTFKSKIVFNIATTLNVETT